MRDRLHIGAALLLGCCMIFQGVSWAQDEKPTAEPSARPAPAPRPARPMPTARNRRPLPGATRVTPDGQDDRAEPFGGVKDGRTPEDPVSFDFQDTSLYEVIKQVGLLTGRNFDVDPSAQSITVTLITHDEIPPEMAYEVLEALLARRGYSLIENLDGHIVEVVSTADAPGSVKLELYQGLDTIPEGYDSYSTHLVQVQYADAVELATALKLVASQQARIDTYAPTNMLLITDTSDGLRRIRTFLEKVDVPGLNTTMEVFMIEFTRAELLATQIEQVLMDDGGASAPAATPRPTAVSRSTRPVRTQVPGAPDSQVVGSSEETLRMVPDERLNALIVVASAGMMEQVRDLVKRLDTIVPSEQDTLHIYELLNADAEDIEEALQQIVGGSGRSSARSRTSGASRSGASRTTPTTTPGATTSEIQTFDQEITIARYDQTNSLLIMASPQDYRKLANFIARLDVPRRQVFVETMVMDVSITDSYGLNVNAAAVTGNDGFAMARTDLISQLAITAADAESLAGAGGAFALGLLGQGAGGGFTAGVRDEVTINVGGAEVDVPYVPLLLQAVEELTELEVLSQPSLVVVDGGESEDASSISVGQEVPFVSGSSRPAVNSDGDIVSSGGYGSTRVERQDVGIQLEVEAQITEGEKVRLDLRVEVSEVASAEQSVGDANILGPTTNKTLVENTVWVRDGETAIIAGMIRDSSFRDRRRVPLLGDIPGLGWLFGSSGTTRGRKNMVVLVTPHIIKEGTDMERLTQHAMTQYHDENLRQMWEDGFFQRIKKKHYNRTQHRPTLERSEELTGRRSNANFQKGDIDR